MIAFVVLHYQNLLDTNEAISAIQNTVGLNDYKIVVIDNASPNGTGKKLVEQYQNDPYIQVVCNESNLGFAKGNNVGFRIAKYDWKADYIVMMNNDVNILTDGFGEKIQKIFQREKFAVLGPMVVSADGRCDSNPMAFTIRTEEEAKKNIAAYRKTLKYLKLHMEGLREIIGKIKRSVKKPKPYKAIFQNIHKNVKLHGCCWVFSPLYIECFDGIDEATFMYMEEDILKFHMDQHGLVMMYTPELVVYHKEGAATSAGTTSRGKLERKYDWLIQANQIYLEVLRK